VTYAITWTPRAVDLATELPKDPDGLRAVCDAVDALADEPRPPNTFPFGTTDLSRLRVGRYRVVYEIHDPERGITVMHIGRSA
jgi:mRNA interferase RelE/StbE